MSIAGMLAVIVAPPAGAAACATLFYVQKRNRTISINIPPPTVDLRNQSG